MNGYDQLIVTLYVIVPFAAGAIVPTIAPRFTVIFPDETETPSASAASVLATEFTVTLLATYDVCKGVLAETTVFVALPSPMFE